MAAVFISYRSNDTLAHVGNFHKVLVGAFEGISIFYDAISLKVGDRWKDEIQNHLEEACIVLVLISNTFEWLGVDIKFGSRKIDNSDDWVRKEVCSALSDRNKIVIPVYINANTKLINSVLPPIVREVFPGRSC